MRTYITRFIRDESGATAIEYGLIAAGISVAIIATVLALGSNLNSTFTSVSTASNKAAVQRLRSLALAQSRAIFFNSSESDDMETIAGRCVAGKAVDDSTMANLAVHLSREASPASRYDATVLFVENSAHFGGELIERERF